MTARSAASIEADMLSLDPMSITFRDASALRDVAAADEAAKLADDRLRERVAVARSMGVSWAAIGGVLGVTRQAARQRFGMG